MNRIRRDILQRVQWTVALAVALALGAILRYPGGTTLDATTDGYSMWRNFLSDLGMTVAFNGHPNKLGASLFVASLLVLIVGLGSSLAAIIRLLWADPASRRWAGGAAACLVLACAAFAGVAMTPENRVMELHIRFTMWGWRLVPLIAGLMAVASLRSAVFRGRVALVWSFVALLLAGYAAILAWGPTLDSTDGLRAQVMAQKAATALVMLALIYVAGEAERARRERLAGRYLESSPEAMTMVSEAAQ